MNNFDQISIWDYIFEIYGVKSYEELLRKMQEEYHIVLKS